MVTAILTFNLWANICQKGHFTALPCGQKQKPTGYVLVSAEYKTGPIHTNTRNTADDTFPCSYLKGQTHDYTSVSIKWAVFVCMITSHHHCTIHPGVYGTQQYPSVSLVSVFLIGLLRAQRHISASVNETVMTKRSLMRFTTWLTSLFSLSAIPLMITT